MIGPAPNILDPLPFVVFKIDELVMLFEFFKNNDVLNVYRVF